jgi:hypothetical protein
MVGRAFYRDWTLHLDHAMASGLFAAPVAAIAGELRQVLGRVPTLSHVFLVGGFSESDIVRAAVQRVLVEHAAKHGHEISMVCPPHASLAVLTGAVMYGLRPSVVQARYVKKTYGVAVSCEWNPKKHSDRKKSFRPNEGKLVAFCDGIFSPFCLAGDQLAVDHVVTQVYTPGEDHQEEMVLKVFETDGRAPTFVDAPGARLAGTMTLPMPQMTGNLTRRVQVTMRFGTTEIEISAIDMTSGRDCGARLSCLDPSLVAPSWSSSA